MKKEYILGLLICFFGVGFIILFLNDLYTYCIIVGTIIVAGIKNGETSQPLRHEKIYYFLECTNKVDTVFIYVKLNIFLIISSISSKIFRCLFMELPSDNEPDRSLL